MPEAGDHPDAGAATMLALREVWQDGFPAYTGRLRAELATSGLQGDVALSWLVRSTHLELRKRATRTRLQEYRRVVARAPKPPKRLKLVDRQYVEAKALALADLLEAETARQEPPTPVQHARRSRAYDPTGDTWNTQ